ncbi:hypothetical protein CsSME_00017303 [Camellia sinensis var. sinensis]
MRRSKPTRTDGKALHTISLTTNRTSPEEREWWTLSFKLQWVQELMTQS